MLQSSFNQSKTCIPIFEKQHFAGFRLRRFINMFVDASYLKIIQNICIMYSTIGHVFTFLLLKYKISKPFFYKYN